MYEGLNPYEFIYMSRLGDSYARTALFRMYEKKLMCKVNVEMKRNGRFKIYRDDFVDEAYLALLIAMESYRPVCNCSFDTYLDIVIKRRFVDLIRKYNTASRIQVHNCIPFDAAFEHLDYVCTPELMASPLEEPEYYVRYQDAKVKLKEIVAHLSKKEKEIYDLWYEDLSYEEASQRLGISKSAYAGRLYRLKKSIREQLEE